MADRHHSEDHPRDIDGIGCGLYSLARHARHLDGLRNQTHMNPRVTDVKPQPEYKLKLTFTNGEVRVFDMKPYLDTGIFQQLREEKLFNSVRPVLGSIQCENEADLCPDTLYEKSRPVASAKPQRFQVAESRTRYGRKRR